MKCIRKSRSIWGSDCMRLNAQTLNKTKLTWVSIARDFVETKIECICDWITAFEKQTRELKLSINALLYRRLYYPSARGWPSRNLSACKGERICCFCACTPLFLSKNPGGKQVQDFFFCSKVLISLLLLFETQRSGTIDSQLGLVLTSFWEFNLWACVGTTGAKTGAKT